MVNFQDVIGDLQKQKTEVQQEKQKAEKQISKLQEKGNVQEQIARKKQKSLSPGYRVAKAHERKQKKKAEAELKEYTSELEKVDKEIEEQKKKLEEYKSQGYQIKKTDDGYSIYKMVQQPSRLVPRAQQDPAWAKKVLEALNNAKDQKRYLEQQIAKGGVPDFVMQNLLATLERRNRDIESFSKALGQYVRVTPSQELEAIVSQVKDPRKAYAESIESLKQRIEVEKLVEQPIVKSYTEYRQDKPKATLMDYAIYKGTEIKNVLDNVQTAIKLYTPKKSEQEKNTISQLKEIDITPDTFKKSTSIIIGDTTVQGDTFNDLVDKIATEQKKQINKDIANQTIMLYKKYGDKEVVSDILQAEKRQDDVKQYRLTGSVPNWFGSEVTVPKTYQALGLEDEYKKAAFEQSYGVNTAPPGTMGPVVPPLLQFQQQEVPKALETATPSQTNKYIQSLKEEGQFRDPSTGEVVTFQKLKEKGIKDLKLVDGQLVFVPKTAEELGEEKYNLLVDSYKKAGYTQDEANRIVNTRLATVGVMTLGIDEVYQGIKSSAEKMELENYLNGIRENLWSTPEEYVDRISGWAEPVKKENLQRINRILSSTPKGFDTTLYLLALEDEAFAEAAKKLPKELEKRTLQEWGLSAISPLYNIASTSYGKQVLGSEAMVHGVYIPAITLGAGALFSAGTKIGTEALSQVAPKLAKITQYALPAGMLGVAGAESGRQIWEAYQPKEVTMTTPSGEFYTKQTGGFGSAIETAAPIALAWASAGEGARIASRYNPQLTRAGQRLYQRGGQAFMKAQNILHKGAPKTYGKLQETGRTLKRMIDTKTVEREGGLYRPEELTDIYQDWQTSDYTWPEQHPLYQKKFPMEYPPSRPWERIEFMPSGAGEVTGAQIGTTGISLAGRSQYGAMSDYFLPDQPLGKPSTRRTSGAIRKSERTQLLARDIGAESIRSSQYLPFETPRQATLSLRGKTFQLRDITSDVLQATHRKNLLATHGLQSIKEPIAQTQTSPYSIVKSQKNWLKGLQNIYDKQYYRDVYGLNRKPGERMSYEAMRALYGKEGVQDITETSFIPQTKVKSPKTFQTETDVINLIKEPTKITKLSDKKTGKNIKFVTEKDVTDKKIIEGIDNTYQRQKTVQVTKTIEKKLDVDAYIKQEGIKILSPEEYMYNNPKYIPEIWREDFIKKIRYSKTLPKAQQEKAKKNIIKDIKDAIYSKTGEFLSEEVEGGIALGFYKSGSKELVVSSTLPKTKLKLVLEKLLRFKKRPIPKSKYTQKDIATHEALHYKRYKENVPFYRMKNKTYGEVHQEENIIENIREKIKKPFEKKKTYNIVKKETGFLLSPEDMEVKPPLPSIKRARTKTIEAKKAELASKDSQLQAQLMRGEITKPEYDRRINIIHKRWDKLVGDTKNLEKIVEKVKLQPIIKKTTITKPSVKEILETDEKDAAMQYQVKQYGIYVEEVKAKTEAQAKKLFEKLQKKYPDLPIKLVGARFSKYKKLGFKQKYPSLFVKGELQRKLLSQEEKYLNEYDKWIGGGLKDIPEKKEIIKTKQGDVQIKYRVTKDSVYIEWMSSVNTGKGAGREAIKKLQRKYPKKEIKSIPLKEGSAIFHRKVGFVEPLPGISYSVISKKKVIPTFDLNPPTPTKEEITKNLKTDIKGGKREVIEKGTKGKDYRGVTYIIKDDTIIIDHIVSKKEGGGTELIKELMKKYPKKKLVAFSVPKAVGFYEKLGFREVAPRIYEKKPGTLIPKKLLPLVSQKEAKQDIKLLPPSRESVQIKEIQEKWTPKQLEEAIKTKKVDKWLLRKVPVLLEYWDPYQKKLIRVILKKSLPHHKKRLAEIKKSAVELPGALEKMKFEAMEQKEIKPSVRVKNIFSPKRAAFYKPYIDPYQNLRGIERAEKAKQLQKDKKKDKEQPKNIMKVTPEVEYTHQIEIYGNTYRVTKNADGTTDWETVNRLKKLKKFEEKQKQKDLELEKEQYQGLTRKQEMQRRKIVMEALREERKVKQELNKLEAQKKIDKKGYAMETWGAMSYPIMENIWRAKEEPTPEKIAKEKRKGTSLKELEERFDYSTIRLKPTKQKLKPKPKEEEIVSGAYTQVQVQKQKLQPTYTTEEILLGEKMYERIKKRLKEVEDEQNKLWNQQQIQEKTKALIQQAQAIKDELKKLHTIQEQRRLQATLQYTNQIIRKLGDTIGLGELSNEELETIVKEIEELEKDIKEEQITGSISAQGSKLDRRIKQLQRQQQKLMMLQESAEDAIHKTIEEILSATVQMPITEQAQKQRTYLDIYQKQITENTPIYEQLSLLELKQIKPPTPTPTPILMQYGEEPKDKKPKKKIKMKGLGTGYQKKIYDVPNIWKAGGKKPTWATKSVNHKSIAKKTKTFTITGAKK